ncbi:hypothetical protein [Hymenobacter defluvii]|uniref:Uncharacterized protein n=1 Tax=Hymenobacter defluvii TaxID=2054411 RepID=A0ABS3THQ3_9BACT|nr:hypothetical protein [Hymenobacter defluvii]MBO3273201.1 hypothetical protein [Hymenobacter defluvii]
MEEQFTGALADARRYFPELLSPFSAPDNLPASTDRQVVLTFARTLALWASDHLGQRLVLEDFDKGYDRVPEKEAYVDACERMLNKVRIYSEGHYPQPNLFPDAPLYPGGPLRPMEEVWRDVRSSVWRFREWVRWRRYTPIEQLLEVLTTVQIRKQGEFPGEYTVHVKPVGGDDLWFKALVRSFRRAAIHAAPHELAIPFDTLRAIKELDLSRVIRVEELHDQQKCSLSTLLSDYPMLHLKGLEEEHVISEQVAEDFWINLLHELINRITWGYEAYNVVATKLDKPQADNPLVTEQNIKKWVRTGRLKEKNTTGTDDKIVIPDPWSGILLNDYTVDDLDKLLFDTELLVDINNRTLAPEAKGSSVWVGIAEGLSTRKRLDFTNRSKVYRALIRRYGKEICSKSTMEHGYKPTDAKASAYAATVQARVASL